MGRRPRVLAAGDGNEDSIIRAHHPVLTDVMADLVAEVERDPIEARSDPDDLAAGAELVEPGGAVAAEAARQHVVLPGPGGQRHTLHGHQRLPQTVGAGAGGAVGVHVLPAGQEARQLPAVGRLHLLAELGEALLDLHHHQPALARLQRLDKRRVDGRHGEIGRERELARGKGHREHRSQTQRNDPRRARSQQADQRRALPRQIRH